MTTADLRFRDLFRRYLPPWLAERVTRGKTVGYRFLWTIVAPLDAAAEVLFQGLRSWLPGLGTPTALPLIGRSRGFIRNQTESEADFGERLTKWLDVWPEAGWEERSARMVHEFLASRPRVRVVTRDGRWTTIETDGSVTRVNAPWDWDSVSHPERNDPDEPWWSDLWMIVYMPEQWPLRPGTLAELVGDDGFAIGHMARHEEIDAVKGLLSQWKSAHSRWRAVIFTTDVDRFDPAVPASKPDGTWGAWGMNDGGSYVPSGRDLTTCRYWEPR